MSAFVLRSALAGALIACTLSGAATAQDRVFTGAPSFFDNDLTFEVAGTISPNCTVDQQSQRASFGPLLNPRVGGNIAASMDLQFSFECNSPFRVAMSSQKGGLATEARGGSQFRNRMDYTARLILNDGRGTDTCKSADMMTGAGHDDRCVFQFQNREGAAGPAVVRLSMHEDNTPLLAGAYADRLVLRITPLLGGDAD